MPELPEVTIIVRELKETITGKKIAHIAVTLPKWQRLHPERAVDHTITDIRRRAKLIIWDLDIRNMPRRTRHRGKHLVFHLKLTGQLFFLPKGQEKTKTGEGIGPFTHAIFTFADGSRIIFNDMRQFGYIKFLRDQELEKTLSAEHFGPEPFDKTFTQQTFKEMLKKKSNAMIKPLLMDQAFISGIGNAYSDEMLFEAKIHPKRKAGTLTDTEVEKLYDAMREVLKLGIKTLGMSMDTYRRITGERGMFDRVRKVYRREGLPCPRCRTVISRMKFGGRSAHFCPHCQRLDNIF